MKLPNVTETDRGLILIQHHRSWPTSLLSGQISWRTPREDDYLSSATLEQVAELRGELLLSFLQNNSRRLELRLQSALEHREPNFVLSLQFLLGRRNLRLEDFVRARFKLGFGLLKIGSEELRTSFRCFRSLAGASHGAEAKCAGKFGRSRVEPWPNLKIQPLGTDLASFEVAKSQFIWCRGFQRDEIRPKRLDSVVWPLAGCVKAGAL